MSKYNYFEILFLLIIFSFFGNFSYGQKLIKTPVGNVRGRLLKLSIGRVTEYLGIPFAYPPTGLYRFRGPVELKKPAWGGIFYARELANSCIQFIKTINFTGYDDLNPKNVISEDCLQLNMWVPYRNSGNVIVFIHGGSFNFGSASLDFHNGSMLATRTMSTVVNLNYRLGIFGFGYLGDNSDVKGNMGFLDQQMGLKWVHDNIKAFGGDPSKVTLFGESAGSASVIAHLYSEGSYPYFSKIIAASGVITNVWATVPNDIAMNNTLEVALKLGCSGNDIEILSCLQKVDANTLLLTSLSVKHPSQLPLNIAFYPIDSDTVFFKGSVKQKNMEKMFKKDVDIMIGRTFNEGTYFMPLFLEQFGCKFDPTKEINSKENQCLLDEVVLPQVVKVLAGAIGFNEEETESLYEIYESRMRTNKTRGKVADLLSDFLFNCFSASFASSYNKETQNDVYFYEFRKRSPINPWPKWMGAMHGWELEYFFGYPIRHPEKYPSDEIENETQFSYKLMYYIENFLNSRFLSREWIKFGGAWEKALVMDKDFAKSIDDKYVNAIPKTCKSFYKIYLNFVMRQKNELKRN